MAAASVVSRKLYGGQVSVPWHGKAMAPSAESWESSGNGNHGSRQVWFHGTALDIDRSWLVMVGIVMLACRTIVLRQDDKVASKVD